MSPISGTQRDGLGKDDITHPTFADECARQSQTIAEADSSDPTLAEFLDEALADLENQDT